MKKIRLSLSIIFALLIFALPAHATLVYSVSNYAAGAAGVIFGNSTSPQIVVQNLSGDATAATFTGYDGVPRILTCNKDSWVTGAGDTNQVYNPYGGPEWNKKPEAEFSSKYTEGPFAGTYDGNAHGVVSMGDKLYISYWGNTYNFFGIDYTSKVCMYDMKNGYIKEKEYIYRPEDENPDLAANCAGIFEYNGYLYAVYTGYRKPGPTPSNPYSYDMDSAVIKLTKDLEFVSKVTVKGKNIFSFGGMGGAIENGKIYVCSSGGITTDLPQPSPESCLSVVDLDTMTSSTPVSVQSLRENGLDIETNFCSASADENGNVYILTFRYDVGPGGSFGDKHIMRLYRTTHEKLMTGDIGELVKETQWAGSSIGMAYDPETKYIWIAAGVLHRFDGTNWRTFSGKEIGGGIYNISILGYKKSKKKEVSAELTATPAEAYPEDTLKLITAPAVNVSYTAESIAEKAAATSFTADDFVKLPGCLLGIKKDSVFEAAKLLRPTDMLMNLYALQMTDISASGASLHSLRGAGKTLGTVTLKVKGQDLCDNKPSRVRLVALKSSGEVQKFIYAFSKPYYKDGFFTILNEDNSVAASIEPEKLYKVVFYVEDNGKCDADARNGYITLAPAILRYNTSSMPEELVPDIPVPETPDTPVVPDTPVAPQADRTADDSGCNGGFSAFALLLGTPLLLIKRRKK